MTILTKFFLTELVLFIVLFLFSGFLIGFARKAWESITGTVVVMLLSLDVAAMILTVLYIIWSS